MKRGTDCTQEKFLASVAKHKMTIQQDDGVHRCIRFSDPENPHHMHFTLVTWPWYLCISGDMGTFAFSRLEDMFKFFRTKPEGESGIFIDPGYWGEKCEAVSKHEGMKAFSEDLFREQVKRLFDEHFEGSTDEAAKADCWQALEDDVLRADNTYAAYDLASGFSHDDFRLEDFFECEVEEVTYHYIWCCYAIAWGIAQYDAWSEARKAEAAAEGAKSGGGMSRGKKIGAGCFGIFGVLTFLGVLGIVSESDGGAKGTRVQPAPPAATAAAARTATNPLDKAVEAVRAEGRCESAALSWVDGKAKVDLVVSPGIFVSGNNYVLTTAGTILGAMKTFRESADFKDVWMVVVTLKAPATDKFGNKSQEPVLRYGFKGEDLAKINWDEMDQQGLLDFTDPGWLCLDGAAMVKEYALEGRHAQMAPNFCRIAIEGR